MDTRCPYCNQAHAVSYKCNAHYLANNAVNMANSSSTMANGTYQYRNKEKRRAYMRDYMRKRRG
jgi:hypothetical protein